MIELKEISKKYKDVVALDNVSLNIDGGQIIGLLVKTVQVRQLL